MTVARADIAVGHVDDVASLEKVLAALRQLHGEHYDFAVERWEGEEYTAGRPWWEKDDQGLPSATQSTQPGTLCETPKSELCFQN